LRDQLKSLTNNTLVHILKIDPVTTADSGKYSCIEPGRGGERAVSFSVSVSASCAGNQFKCTADESCIDRSLVCDGTAHCRDRADEVEEAGCGLPVRPTNIQLEWRKYDSLSLRWDRVKMAITYDLRVIHPNGHEVSYLVDGRYPGKTVLGLENGTTYAVKIRSKAMSGYSSFSVLVNFTTLQLETPGKPHNLTGNFADTNRSSFRLRWETPLNLANHPKKGITYRIRLCHIERETFTVTIPPTTTPLATTTRSTPISLKVNETSSFENNVTLTDIPENNTKNLTKTNSTKVPITPAKRAKNVEDGADINPSTTEETPTEEVPTEEVPTGPLRDRRRRAEPELDSSEEEESDSLGSQNDTVSVRNTTNVTAPPATRTVVVFKLVNCSQFEDISEDTHLLSNLTSNSKYFIEVTSIGLKGIVGRSVTMNISTIIPTTAPTTEPAKLGGEISGVLIFSFVTGGLVGLLIIMFILAYIMKWPLVIKGSNDPLSEHNKRKSEAPLDHNYEKL